MRPRSRPESVLPPNCFRTSCNDWIRTDRLRRYAVASVCRTRALCGVPILSTERERSRGTYEQFTNWVLRTHQYELQSIHAADLIKIFGKIAQSRKRQVFVSMQFSEDTKPNFEAVKSAVGDLNFAPVHEASAFRAERAKISRLRVDRHEFRHAAVRLARIPAFDAIASARRTGPLRTGLPGHMVGKISAEDQDGLAIPDRGQALVEPATYRSLGRADRAGGFVPSELRPSAGLTRSQARIGSPSAAY